MNRKFDGGDLNDKMVTKDEQKRTKRVCTHNIIHFCIAASTNKYSSLQRYANFEKIYIAVKRIGDPSEDFYAFRSEHVEQLMESLKNLEIVKVATSRRCR